jgi:hypothetical protein
MLFSSVERELNIAAVGNVPGELPENSEQLLSNGWRTLRVTRNNKRDGKAYLKPVQTMINGVPFGRPYQSPFAVR